MVSPTAVVRSGQVVVRFFQSQAQHINKATGNKIWSTSKVNQIPVDKVKFAKSAEMASDPMEKSLAVRRFGPVHRTPDSKGKIVTHTKVETVGKNLDGTPRVVEQMPPQPNYLQKTGFWSGNSPKSMPHVKQYGPGIRGPDGKEYVKGEKFHHLLNMRDPAYVAKQQATKLAKIKSEKASQRMAQFGQKNKPTGQHGKLGDDEITLFGLGGAVGGAGMGMGFNNNKKKGKRHYDGLPF